MKIKRDFLSNGQGLVEFALLLPILVLFLMVIFDIGRAAYYYSAGQNAAREGARFGAVHWNDPMRTAHIREAVERLTAGLNADELSVVTVYRDLDPTRDSDRDGNSNNDPDAVEVTVTYQFTTATPFLGMLRGSNDNTFVLTSKATMETER